MRESTSTTYKYFTFDLMSAKIWTRASCRISKFYYLPCHVNCSLSTVSFQEMIELFSIFGKGGLVLWCFNEGSNFLNATVNDFVRNAIIHDRSINSYTHDGHTIKYKLDNEFDLIILVFSTYFKIYIFLQVVYQSIVQLAYADKLLTEVHMRFRDLYKNLLNNIDRILVSGPKIFTSFDKEYSMYVYYLPSIIKLQNFGQC